MPLGVSDYKKILNEWIEPNWGGDDMITYNVRNKADSLRLGNRRAPLPRFWKEAVNALEELTPLLELITEKSISKGLGSGSGATRKAPKGAI